MAERTIKRETGGRSFFSGKDPEGRGRGRSGGEGGCNWRWGGGGGHGRLGGWCNVQLRSQEGKAVEVTGARWGGKIIRGAL